MYEWSNNNTCEFLMQYSIDSTCKASKSVGIFSEKLKFVDKVKYVGFSFIEKIVSFVKSEITQF